MDDKTTPLDLELQTFIAHAKVTLDALQSLSTARDQDPYLRVLAAWDAVSDLLSEIKDREMDMRLRLFAGAFSNPKEGVNTHVLPDGRAIKGQYKINRYIDETALPATLQLLREHGVANTDALVRYKPELAKREWNALSEEAKLLFSGAIISSPATPSLEVVVPKRRGRAEGGGA